MAWISVHEQLKDHRKVRELARLLGCSRHEALGVLITLWLWGINNADREGNLGDITTDEIADGAMYRGDSKLLANSLITSRWLDYDNGAYVLHDWDIWQEQWFKSQDRREQSKRLMRQLRTERKDSDVSKQLANCCANVSNSPSPNITLPLPNKDIVSTDVDTPAPQTPFKRILELYHSLCPSLPRVQKLTESRKDKIRVRWGEHPDLEEWADIFRRVQASAFCRGDGGRGWRADLDWLTVNDKNMVKVLEGKYDDQGTQKPTDTPQPPRGRDMRDIVNEAES